MSDILDIKSIVNQSKGLDNLKMILLNNEQYALLNYISKNKLINIEEGNDKINSRQFITEKNFQQNEENSRTLVNQVFITKKEFGNSNMNPITSKLLTYIDSDLLDN